MVRAALFLVTLALAPGITGCGSASATITPNGDAPIVLSTTSKTTRAAARLGNRVTITLPHADPAIYSWQIASHDTRYLKQATEMLLPKTAGEGPTIMFIAIRSGTTRLRFVLLPAGAVREATPIDAHDLVLTINEPPVASQ